MYVPRTPTCELIGMCFWARPHLLSAARVNGALCFLIRCDNSLACMVMLLLPVEILVFRFEALKSLCSFIGRQHMLLPGLILHNAAG